MMKEILSLTRRIEKCRATAAVKVKLPLLSSDPGGVRQPSFHGARQYLFSIEDVK